MQKKIHKRVILFKNILNIYHYNIYVCIYIYLKSSYFLNQNTFSVIYPYLIPVDETFFFFFFASVDRTFLPPNLWNFKSES